MKTRTILFRLGIIAIALFEAIGMTYYAIKLNSEGGYAIAFLCDVSMVIIVTVTTHELITKLKAYKQQTW